MKLNFIGLIAFALVIVNANADTVFDNGTVPVAGTSYTQAQLDALAADDLYLTHNAAYYIGFTPNNVNGQTVFDTKSINFNYGWAWKFTTNHPQIDGGFNVYVDSAQSFHSDIQTNSSSGGPGLKVFYAGDLALGYHKLTSSVNFTSGRTNAESLDFIIEKTNVFARLESVSRDGLIGGGACIKGANTQRIEATSVNLFARKPDNTLLSLGNSPATLSAPSSAITPDCGSSKGFNLQLTERQMQDYCDATLIAKTVHSPFSDVEMQGSSNYLVPCAYRPFVAYVSKSNTQTVTAGGSNFKTGTTVSVYDNNGALWFTKAINYASTNNISFDLPDISPPSRCNVQAACSLIVRFTNPDGAALGVYTQSNLSLSAIATAYSPVVTSSEISTQSTLWNVRVLGSNLQSDLKLTVLDNNGSVWMNNAAFTIVSSQSHIVFYLASNSPPSNCNSNSTCTITVKVGNPFHYSVIDTSLVAYSETTFTFVLPKFIGNTIVARGDNLGSCVWNMNNYVGSDGPNTYNLICNGFAGPVLSKTMSSGLCYLGSAPPGFSVTNSGSCTTFILYKVALVPPTSIATTFNTNSISVSWPSATQATSYRLYRNNAFLTSVQGTSFIDAAVVGGTTYYYSAQSCIGNNCSAMSPISNARKFPTTNTTDFATPKKNNILLGATPTAVPGTTYFTGDTIEFILTSTADAFCSTSGFLGAASYTTTTSAGAYTFAARGPAFYTANAYPFTQIASVRCFQ